MGRHTWHGRGDLRRNARTLAENESTPIPKGAWHRLCNPGEVRLEMIEIQVGGNLSEDDIIRRDDDFGRDTSPEGPRRP